MRPQFLLFSLVAVFAGGVVRAQDLVNESIGTPFMGRADPNSTTTTSTTTTTTRPDTPTTSTTTTTTPIPTTPVTTTAPVVPTTPIPPPPKPPVPSQGTWVVRSGNMSCVMLKLAGAVVIPYRTVNNEVWNATINIPKDATPSGVCGDNEQTIMLSWNVNNTGPLATPNNTVELIFARNITNATSDEGSQFYLSNVNAAIFPDPVNFPGSADVTTIRAHAERASLFATPLNNSYSCRAEQRIPMMTDATANNTGSFVVRNVQMEAFRTAEDDTFHKAVTCDADGMVTSDIVPIAVGCALAALVVVVLIAYLIGRRRARQRGYQSV